MNIASELWAGGQGVLLDATVELGHDLVVRLHREYLENHMRGLVRYAGNRQRRINCFSRNHLADVARVAVAEPVLIANAAGAENRAAYVSGSMLLVVSRWLSTPLIRSSFCCHC
jgi:hypothetical protein